MVDKFWNVWLNARGRKDDLILRNNAEQLECQVHNKRITISNWIFNIIILIKWIVMLNLWCWNPSVWVWLVDEERSCIVCENLSELFLKIFTKRFLNESIPMARHGSQSVVELEEAENSACSYESTIKSKATGSARRLCFQPLTRLLASHSSPLLYALTK